MTRTTTTDPHWGEFVEQPFSWAGLFTPKSWALAFAQCSASEEPPTRTVTDARLQRLIGDAERSRLAISTRRIAARRHDPDDATSHRLVTTLVVAPGAPSLAA